MVTVLISALVVVSTRRLTTPDSFIRLPKQNMPSSGAASGNSSATSTSSRIGNRIFSSRPTGRNCSILMRRCFSVVSSRITGGWINGTRAM